MALSNPSLAPQALDALEASLKTVLLQTGSALSNASCLDGARLGSVRNHLERSLPEALKRWHSALNELEAQLTDAKAALHRDFAASRTQHATQGSTQSLETTKSDTMMVDTQPSLADEAANQGKGEVEDTVNSKPATDATADDVTEQTNPSAKIPQTLEVQTKVTKETASEPATTQHGEQEQPEGQGDKLLLGNLSAPAIGNDKPSPSNPLNLDLTSTPQNINSRSASPLPSIERPAATASNLEDPGNELANTDITAMLPGLMDYANDAMEDFASDPLFTNAGSAGGQGGSMAMDGADQSIDDLFGEDNAGMGGNPFENSDVNMSFDANFSFDDLAAQEAMTGGDDAGSATFDHSFFTDDFFNLEAASGEAEN